MDSSLSSLQTQVFMRIEMRVKGADRQTGAAVHCLSRSLNSPELALLCPLSVTTAFKNN